MTDHLKELSAVGVSIWLDDLNRPLITSGGLQKLMDTSSVVGVTTNPSIFAAALSQGDTYSDQIKGLAAEGRTADEAVFALTTEDVRNACDIMLPVYRATDGQDGRVSIEVEPGLAHDTPKTVEQVRVELTHLGRGAHDERRLSAGDADPDAGRTRARVRVRHLQLLSVGGSRQHR